jgi:hypothetical protein
MSNFKYLPTNESLMFSEVKPGQMFFADNLFWTKHSFLIDGKSGAEALAGYLNSHGTPNRTFDNKTIVFKINRIDQDF